MTYEMTWDDYHGFTRKDIVFEDAAGTTPVIKKIWSIPTIPTSLPKKSLFPHINPRNHNN